MLIPVRSGELVYLVGVFDRLVGCGQHPTDNGRRRAGNTRAPLGGRPDALGWFRRKAFCLFFGFRYGLIGLFVVYEDGTGTIGISPFISPAVMKRRLM